MKYLLSRKLWLLTGFLFSLSGCTVIKSSLQSNVQEVKTNQLYYYLPKGLLQIKSKVKVKIGRNKETKKVEQLELLEQEFEHLAVVVPDTEKLYLLDLDHHIFANDDVKVKINSKGLLETINIKAEDKLPTIIEGIAEGITTVLTSGASTAPLAELDVEFKEFNRTFVLDPKQFPETVSWIISIPNGDNPAELVATFQVEEETTANGYVEGSSLVTITAPSIDSSEGIITRPVDALRFHIESQNPRLQEGKSSFTFYEFLPSTKKVLAVNLNRSAFGTMKSDLTFENGMLVQHDAVKPSEVEGFLSIPINIAKAVVSIPAQLITFKIDNTKNQKQLLTELQALEQEKISYQLENEAKLLEAQKDLVETQKNLEKERYELEKNLFSRELELNKLILDLKKQIQTLQNDIEALKTDQTE